MIPYRIKHKATGLYYKPSKPHLSKVGKVYGTSNNILNYMKNNEFIYIVSTKRPLTRKLEDLGYKTRWIQYSSEVCFDIPKSEFEIEYLINSEGEK